MNFEEAEAKFRQLQARVQRGEPISRAEYEDQVSQLAVQDNNGTLWEINPRTGKWMYFDGAEWISGTPPGHDTSVVIPMPGASSTAPSAPSTPPVSTTQSITPPMPLATRSSASASASAAPPAPESVPTYKRVAQDRRPASPKPPIKPPPGGEPRSTSRTGALGRREWIPLAIGAVVLLVCAILLFVGGNFVMSMTSPTRTPTRIALPTSASSPVPSPVRLPSPTPIPPTPSPVIAKINSDTPANVRNKPTTSGSTIIVKLKKDTQITLIAVGPKDGANTWYQINVPDKTEPGWVRSDVFQVVSGDVNTLPPVGGAAPTATKAPAAPATLTPIGAPTSKP